MAISARDIEDLTRAVGTTNATFADVLGPYAKQLLSQNQVNREIADTIDQAANDLQNIYSNQTSLEQAQNKLFEKQLRRRGYDINKNKVELSGIYDLTVAQQRQLQQLDENIAKERELIRAQDQPVKTFREIARSVTTLSGVIDKLQDQLFEVTGKSVPAVAALNLGIAALTGMVKAALVMSDALYRGERGASVGAKGLKEFSDSVSAAVIGIGAALMFLPFGKVLKIVGAGLALLGAAAQGATKLIEMGAQVNDKLYKSYNDLSERGLTTSKGMDGLYKTLHAVGMSSGNIDKFNSLLTENSKNLAIFGGTAASGAEKFAKVANAIASPTSKLNKEFLLMGIVSDKQREHIIKYMTEEDRLGLAQSLTESQQIAGAVKYIENLDKLSQLTGANRKELEEARDAVMANENLRAAIFAAEQDKTEAGKARLAELKRYYEAAAMLQAAGDTKGATGVAEYAAGRGITGQASAVAFIQFGGKGGLLDRAKRGGTSEELAEAAAKGYQRQMDIMADTRRFGGEAAGLMTGTFAQGQEFTTRIAEAQRKAAEAGYSSLAEYQEAMKEERKNTKDKTTQTNAEVAQLQEKTAQLIDDAAYKMLNSTDLVLGSAMKMMNEAVKLFGDAVGSKKTEEEPVGAVTGTEGAFALGADAAAIANANEHLTQRQLEILQKAQEDYKKIVPWYKRISGVGLDEEQKAAKQRVELAQQAKLDEKDMPEPPAVKAVARPAPTRGIDSKDTTADLVKIFTFGNKSGSRRNFEELQSDFKDRVIAAAKDYNEQTGKRIHVNSAYRDPADQERLWKDSERRGTPGIGPTGMPIARPGKTHHTMGVAIDIQNFNDPIAVTAFNKQGLYQTVKNDPVHFTHAKTAQTGAMFTGPTEGYFVQLHGKEFVGNEKQLDAIKKLMATVIEQASKPKEATTTVVETEVPEDTSEILEKFTDIFQTKTEELIEKLKFGNRVDSDLLNYSQG